MDVDVVVAEVASAVGLAEGPAGVRDVLRVIAHHEPVAAREVGRLAELPVPIVAAVCNELRKRGVAVPAGLAALAGELELAAAGMPAAKLELDQTHCTVDTKLRRVLRMHEAGALAGQRVIVLGDDGLMSLAI